MRRKAETVNFVAGGRWDDQSVGTNALDLANRLDKPAMVFSAEHYAPIVHNWVCWAAPVHDPVTGRQLGVLDLSTTWDRTHPIGLATARVMARLIETAMPRSAHSTRGAYDDDDEPGLVMTLLGTAETRLDGQRLLLNRRQTEVLALLALHPEGLSLEQLHALVYGDQAVTLSTLKAEVSHLRSTLGGQLVAALPADDARHHRRRPRARPAPPRPGGGGGRGVRRGPAARHQLARAGSWPSTSRSRSGRRCWPTRSPMPWSATASGRRTTPRSSRSASPRWRAAPTPPYPCSRAGSRSPAAEPPAGPDPPTFANHASLA